MKNPTKNGLAAGVRPIAIEHHAYTTEPFIIPNGTYVCVGERTASMVGLAKAVLQERLIERRIPSDQSIAGVLLGAMMDWGIGPVTHTPLNTEPVNNCHVLTAVGVATTGNSILEERGLFAHINPTARVLKTNNFEARLRERIAQFCEETHRFTRDILIAGGSIAIESKQRADTSTGFCIDSVEMMADLCKNMDVEPTVTLPVLQSLERSMALDTQSRTLHIRPAVQYQFAQIEEHFPRTFPASQAREIITRLRAALSWKS